MFRTRVRTEIPSRTGRGSVGSARVWDDSTRARGGPVTAAPAEARLDAPLLGSDELMALVTGIVQVTLDTQLADCEPERRGAIARVLEARLLALLGLAGATGPAPAPAAALVETEEPASEPAPPPTNGHAAPAAREVVYPPALRALGLVLEDRLQRLGGPLAERDDLRRTLVAITLGFVPPPELAPAGDATSAEMRDLDLLQRRATKLEQALREARKALAYVSGLEHVDDGIASIYRAVQGIALDDPLRDRKRGAMEAIFQANLGLQKKQG